MPGKLSYERFVSFLFVVDRFKVYNKTCVYECSAIVDVLIICVAGVVFVTYSPCICSVQSTLLSQTSERKNLNLNSELLLYSIGIS